MLTGYRDHRGLQISLIGLDGAPRVASTLRLDGRYESEGRSHAFNSLMERDGSGIMGLPTVRRDIEGGAMSGAAAPPICPMSPPMPAAA